MFCFHKTSISFLLKIFSLYLLITESLKPNKLAATLSQDLGLIFEAIHDAFHLVLDKATIEFFDAVEVADIGEEYWDAVIGHGVVFDVIVVIGGAKIRG